MDIVLRTTEFVIGFLLVYLRFGLYESQEGRLQDRLAELWIQIDDFSPVLRQRMSRLLTETARLTLRLFDHVFGAKAFSLQTLNAATLIVLTSTLFTLSMVALAQGGSVAGLVIAMTGTLALVFLLAVPHTKPYVILSLICVGCTAAIVGWLSFAQETQLRALATAFVATVCFELIWLFMQRALLRFSMREGRLLASVAFLACPVLTAASIGLQYYLVRSSSGFWMYFWVETLLARFASLVIALPHLVILVALLVHATAWPLLARIVYGLERHNVFRERKAFGTVGAVLIVHAIAGRWFVEAIKLL